MISVLYLSPRAPSWRPLLHGDQPLLRRPAHASRHGVGAHAQHVNLPEMLSRALRPRARAAALATSRISRTLATKPAGGSSPFAPPPEPEASGDGKLTRYEELKQRQDDMAKMMMEKTMLEVNNAAKVRP